MKKKFSFYFDDDALWIVIKFDLLKFLSWRFCWIRKFEGKSYLDLIAGYITHQKKKNQFIEIALSHQIFIKKKKKKFKLLEIILTHSDLIKTNSNNGIV